MRTLWIGVIALTGLLLAGELTLRIVGATGFPVYVRDAADQYHSAPNQRGTFLRRSDWVYNEHGMGVAAPFRPVGSLIIGDSETEGSISFMKQAGKVGPLLQKDTGSIVWPVGAKGWGLANELGWLNSHPEVFALKRIMILSNRGDFGPAHGWDDEFAHPTHHPWFASIYLVGKYFYRPDPRSDDPHPSAESTAKWHEALHQFLTTYRGQVIFIELPVRNDIVKHLDGFRPLTDELTAEHRANLFVIRIADDPAWNAGLYHNDYHPSPAGNRELAAYVSHHLPAVN